MTSPVVSVCIVTCDQHTLIETCVRSVAEQDVDAELRILVGDDASRDGTSDIVASLAAEYPGRIQHIRREPRMGAFENMQDLMCRADGDLVARVDGDDYWLPGKLTRQLRFMLAHPDCTAVYTNAITVDDAGQQIGLFNDAGDARCDLADLLRRGNFLVNSSVLFRPCGRQAWLGTDTPHIDFAAHLLHARRGWIAHFGEPLTAYRRNSQGSMVASMNDRVRELYWEAIQSVPRDRVSDDDYAHGIADFLRRVFFRTIRTRQWRLLKEWVPRVFAASPFGKIRTTLLTLSSILRILWKEFIGLFARDADGRRIRVLYRR